MFGYIVGVNDFGYMDCKLCMLFGSLVLQMGPMKKKNKKVVLRGGGKF